MPSSEAREPMVIVVFCEPMVIVVSDVPMVIVVSDVPMVIAVNGVPMVPIAVTVLSDTSVMVAFSVKM
jgi:hypothetical protein